jgi:DNA-binding response OmpR family regulator
MHVLAHVTSNIQRFEEDTSMQLVSQPTSSERRGEGRAERQRSLQTHQPHVLLAEDDSDMRDLLTEILCQAGYRVTQAEDGLELFDELRRAHRQAAAPAVIISDVRMPGLTGLEVLDAVRQAGSKVPVILITAFGNDEVCRDAARMGVDAVLIKPFDVEELRTTVTALIQRRQRSA